MIGTPGEYEVSEDEKNFVKGHILDVLLHCMDQSNLRSQALECVKLIVNCEFPFRWSALLPQCLGLISSGEEPKVYCGLASLRVIAREFEVRSTTHARATVEEITRVALPGLLTLGEQLLKTVAQSPLAVTLLKLILKTYYSCTQLKLSPVLAEQGTCTRWFELMSQATKVTCTTNANMDECEEGKLQKWAFRIQHRFLSRYGNPDLADADDLGEGASPGADMKQFSTWWLNTFGPPLVLLVSDGVKERLSRTAKFEAISFLSESIQHAATYKALKTRLQVLLFEVIFPLLCFNADDNELWNSDPEEYVRRQFDYMGALNDPKEAAVEFLKNMVQMRSKDSLGPLLHFCESHLFVESATPSAMKDIARCSRKDGALAIIGSIAAELCVASKKKKSKSKKTTSSAGADRLPDRNQLETLLSKFVLIDFSSPVGFLRYRACWVYEQFANEAFAFSNPQTTAAAFAGFRKCLTDSELPVRVQSGVSVHSFITHEEFGPLIQPFVPELLDKLLKLMHEVECEPLASTLESLVRDYSEQVLPFAVQAIEQLNKVFIRLMESSDDDDDAQLACMGCMQTICTIMESACSKPELFVALEPVCYPVLDKIFTEDGCDYMEEGLDMLTYLTFYTAEPLSQGLWKYYDLLHQSVCGGQLPGLPLKGAAAAEGWAVDYAENMLNVMDNYVSRGTRIFVSGNGFCGRSYIQMLFELVSRALANDSEQTQVAGAQIAACVFESCPRGSISDEWVKMFIQLGWSKFSIEKNLLNRWLFYLFTMALYYDPVATAKAAESLGITGDLFAAFSQLSNFSKSKDERKALCISLCGLIRRLGDLGPNHVASTHLKAYVEVLAVQTRDIAELRRKAREAATAAEEEEEEDSDEDDDEDDEIDIQDLDEGQSADQSAKLRLSNKLKEQIAQIRQQYALGGGDDDDDYDDDDYDDDDDDEDCERISPLDAFNEFSIIKETLTGLGSAPLLSWFSQPDLVSWNQLLDENIAKDQQAKAP